MRTLNYFFYIFSQRTKCTGIEINSIQKLEGCFSKTQHTILDKKRIQALINKKIISFPYCMIYGAKDKVIFKGNPIDNIVELNTKVNKYLEPSSKSSRVSN